MPSIVWTVGGTDGQAYRRVKEGGRLGELPTSHNRRLAPVLQATLRTGIETLVSATRPGERRSEGEKSSSVTST